MSELPRSCFRGSEMKAEKRDLPKKFGVVRAVKRFLSDKLFLTIGISLTAIAISGVSIQAFDHFGERSVRPTWEEGYLRIDLNKDGLIVGRMDNPIVHEEMRRLLKNRKLPTVIYAHGCSGLLRDGNIQGGHRRFIQLLARAGYAVIAPDSFARKGRPLSCDPKKKRGIPGAPHKRINRMRQAEIRYAAKRAREISWVDRDNLFLFGHSQGGTNAARYDGSEFRAHIVSGSICWGGVRVPKHIPVFAIYSKRDPWLRGRNPKGCEVQAKKRKRSIEFHLFPGDVHNLSRNKIARGLILEFIRLHSK